MTRAGKIEWYSEKRGFGIISSPAADGGLDKFFVHITKIVRNPEIIAPGQAVTFDVSESAVRRVGDLPMAINITIQKAAQ